MRGVDRRRIVGWRGGIDRMEKPDATPTSPICRRETRNQLHKLHDILMIVPCAVLSGVETGSGWKHLPGRNEAQLRGFLKLSRRIPSRDTLNDVLGQIDPVAIRTASIAH